MLKTTCCIQPPKPLYLQDQKSKCLNAGKPRDSGQLTSTFILTQTPPVTTKGHLQWKPLSNPPPITGTMDRHLRGWVLSPITTMTFAMRTWKASSERACRMYPHAGDTQTQGGHTDPLISLTSGPGFNTQPARTRASPEDSLFEINQTGLSPMWYDKHPLSSPPEPHAFLGGTLPRRTLTRGWDVRPCQLGHRFPFNT